MAKDDWVFKGDAFAAFIREKHISEDLKSLPGVGDASVSDALLQAFASLN